MVVIIQDDTENVIRIECEEDKIIIQCEGVKRKSSSTE